MRSMLAKLSLAVLLGLLPSSVLAHPQPPTGGATPKYGGTLVYSNRVEPKTLNPDITSELPGGTFFVTHTGVMNRLVADDMETGGVFPDLAERWEVSPDAKVYTFYIHPKAKWHDGQKATARDVKWTFDKILKEKTWQTSLIGGIEKTEAIDDQTVRITLKAPDASFLTVLGDLNAPVILPMHLYDGTDWQTNKYNEAPIGTGPFKFVEWKKGSYVAFEANKDYHWGRPYVDKMVLRFINSAAVDMAALESGEIQFMIQNADYGEVGRLSQDPKLRVSNLARLVPVWLAYNLQKKPWDDIRVRQAIAYAIDKEDVAKRAYFGLTPVSKGTYMSRSWAFNPNSKQPEYDPAKAEALLDEAGLKKGPDGIRMKVTIDDSVTLGFKETNLVLKEQLRKVGIDVTTNSIEFGVFSQKVLQKKDFDLAVVGGPHGPDPSLFNQFVVTGKTRNSGSYSNPRVDELFNLAVSTPDQEKRKQYYYEVQDIISKDLPRLNIVELVYPYASRSDYHGFWTDPEYQGKVATYDMSHLWWEGAGGTAATDNSTLIAGAAVGVMLLVIIVGGGGYLLSRRRRIRAD